MANNFKSVEVTLANASEANVIAATSNNQIMIGLNACNTSTTASITLDVTLRDGSNDFKMVKTGFDQRFRVCKRWRQCI